MTTFHTYDAVIVGARCAGSALAIELARERSMTLCGFAREGRVSVYADSGRVG